MRPAKRMLALTGPAPGGFLVRLSESQPDSFVVQIQRGGRIRQQLLKRASVRAWGLIARLMPPPHAAHHRSPLCHSGRLRGSA